MKRLEAKTAANASYFSQSCHPSYLIENIQIIELTKQTHATDINYIPGTI